MFSKIKIESCLFIVVLLGFAGIANANGIWYDPNVYQWVGEGEPNSSKEPGGDGWERIPSFDDITDVNIEPGESEWFAVNNPEEDPNRVKTMELSVRIRPMAEANDIEAEQVEGYKSNGCTSNVDRGPVTTSGQFDEWITFYFWFTPQPAFEFIKLKNTGEIVAEISKFQVSFTCHKDKVDDIYHYSTNVNVSQDNITKIAFWYEDEPINSSIEPELTIHDVNAGIWAHEYITEDPNTGDALPEGGWLFTLTSGNGIDRDTSFDLKTAMENCKPDGYFWLKTYDTETDSWAGFVREMDEPTTRPADINGDCDVDFLDFAELADKWLQ